MAIDLKGSIARPAKGVQATSMLLEALQLLSNMHELLN